MKACGFEVLDATCPFVLKIHRLVEKYSKEGYRIVIAGNEHHPEVEGILGWVEGQPAYTVTSQEDIEKLPLKEGEKVCLVAQTTFNYNKFQELVEIIKKKGCLLYTSQHQQPQQHQLLQQEPEALRLKQELPERYSRLRRKSAML